MPKQGDVIPFKTGDLKGRRNILRIECSCSGIAVWIAYGNKKFDAKERRKFIDKHKDHPLNSVRSKTMVF